MKLHFVALGAIAFASSALAQTPAADVPATVPANTEVVLKLNKELNSQQIKKGDKFDLTVAQDVTVGNTVVIPRGTPAHGEVTMRTGKGAFGKSAKFEVEMRSIDLNGRTIPLNGHFRQAGKGNAGAAVGAVVAVGVFGAFVTGHSAVYKEGAEFKATTK